MNNNFNQKEVLFIIKYYQIFGSKYCQQLLNKTKGQLDNLVHKLGIKAIKPLSYKERQVIYLHINKYKRKDIPKILNISYGAYEKRRIRGLKKLEERYDMLILKNILLKKEEKEIKKMIKRYLQIKI